jgi:hypothetical protein
MIAVIRHPSLGVILFDTGYGRAVDKARGWYAPFYRRVLPFELPETERVAMQLTPPHH